MITWPVLKAMSAVRLSTADTSEKKRALFDRDRLSRLHAARYGRPQNPGMKENSKPRNKQFPQCIWTLLQLYYYDLF
jgi:hypothetical protein